MGFETATIRGWTIAPGPNGGGVMMPIWGPPERKAPVPEPPSYRDGTPLGEELKARLRAVEAREARVAEGLTRGEWTPDLEDYVEHKTFLVAEAKAIDAKHGTLEAIVSTSEKDRIGDVIEADGWDLDNYRRNPVLLWNHNYDLPPIGRALAVKVAEGALRAVFKFADTERAREVRQLYEHGSMRAFSVGFRPLRWEPLPGGGRRYTKTELLEISAVPVPALPSAVVTP